MDIRPLPSVHRNTVAEEGERNRQFSRDRVGLRGLSEGG